MSGVGVIILSTQWLAVVGSVPTSTTWVRKLRRLRLHQDLQITPVSSVQSGGLCVSGSNDSGWASEELVLWCMQAALQAARSALSNVNLQAVAVGSISLLCSLFTPKALAKFVPGSLIGLLAGTAAAYFGKMGALPSHSVRVWHF